MGKITVFSLDGCPHCKKAKDLLTAKGATFTEISLTKTPEWRPQLFILSNGCTSSPQVFFNSRHVGGGEELERMKKEGTLGDRVKECLEGEWGTEFPPPLRAPKSEEFLQVIPDELQSKWQKDVDDLDAKLGGTPDKPISSLLLMLETPQEMVVVCTTGPGKEIFSVGASGAKGQEGSEEKLYCQVAIEKKETLFIDDPTKIPGLEKNEDWVKFGYGYYVGAPWVVGQTQGTIVAMEKEPGILKAEHKVIIDQLRDQIERDFTQYRESHK